MGRPIGPSPATWGADVVVPIAAGCPAEDITAASLARGHILRCNMLLLRRSTQDSIGRGHIPVIPMPLDQIFILTNI